MAHRALQAPAVDSKTSKPPSVDETEVAAAEGLSALDAAPRFPLSLLPVTTLTSATGLPTAERAESTSSARVHDQLESQA